MKDLNYHSLQMIARFISQYTAFLESMWAIIVASPINSPYGAYVKGKQRHNEICIWEVSSTSPRRWVFETLCEIWCFVAVGWELMILWNVLTWQRYIRTQSDSLDDSDLYTNYLTSMWRRTSLEFFAWVDAFSWARVKEVKACHIRGVVTDHQ